MRLASHASIALVLALAIAAAGCSWHRWQHKQIGLPSCEMTYHYTGFAPHDPPQHARYYLLLFRDASIQYGDPAPPNVPVLFVPGNAGSHKQARSFASETARQWSRQQHGEPGAPALRTTDLPNLDWYMVDTREELSAFDGAVLEDQVQYVLQCLAHLKAAYGKPPGGPHSAGVLLVGHSIGGVVARAAAGRAALDPDLGPDLVIMLTTLASPHQRPPLPSAPSLHRFYDGLARLPPMAAPVLSLAGGYNDSQVAAGLTKLPSGVTSAPKLSLSVNIEDVPGSWASAHHACILWCNQLVTKLSAVLLRAAQEAKKHLQRQQRQEQRPNQKRLEEPGRGPSRGEAVMNGARLALLSGGLHDQLMLRGGALGDRVAGFAGRPDLAAELKRPGRRRACQGANLAWYLQYNTPVQVTGKLLQLSYASIKGRLGTTGLQYFWDLKRSGLGAGTENASFTLVVSGAKPCTGFKVWLHRPPQPSPMSWHPQQAPHSGGRTGEGGKGEGVGEEEEAWAERVEREEGEEDAASDQLGREVDVTALVAQLPPLHAKAQQPVRVWSEAAMVIAGKDYEQAATWALRLPAELITGAEGITLWLGTVSLKKAFQLTAELHSDVHSTPAVDLGGGEGGAATLLLPPRLASSPSSSSSSSSRSPDAAEGGSQQRSSSSSSKGMLVLARLQLPWYIQASGLLTWRTLGLYVHQQAPPGKRKWTCLHPLVAIRAGRGDGGAPESLQANLSAFSLRACAGQAAGGGGGAAGGCEVTLLLDRACGHRLALAPDLAAALPEVLLLHVHALWGLAQAAALLSLAAATEAVAASATPLSSTTEPLAPGVASTALKGMAACSLLGLVRCLLSFLQSSGLLDGLGLDSTALGGPLRSLLLRKASSAGLELAALALVLAPSTSGTLLAAPTVASLAERGLAVLGACVLGASATAPLGKTGTAATAAAVRQLAGGLGRSAASSPLALGLDAALLLWLAAGALLLALHATLAAAAWLLRFCWRAVSWPVAGRLRGGSCAGAAWWGLGAASMALAAALMHHQAVALACLLLLLVASHASPHFPGWGPAARRALLLFAVGAAVSTPSLVARIHVQLLQQQSPVAALAAPHLQNGQATPIELSDLLLGLLPAAACWLMAHRAASGATALPQPSGSSNSSSSSRSRARLAALVLRSLARVGLACAALGLDWVPRYVQAAAAVVCCLTALTK